MNGLKILEKGVPEGAPFSHLAPHVPLASKTKPDYLLPKATVKNEWGPVMAAGTTKKPTAKKAAAKPLAPKDSAIKIMVPSIDMAAVMAAGANGVADKADAANSLKKKQLVERVAEAIGGKKKDVKEIVEATLTVLGEALQRGESLHLPPFGHAKVARSKGEGKDSSMTVKLRGAGEKVVPKPKKETLAEVGEDS